jgi:hypothetical protein
MGFMRSQTVDGKAAGSFSEAACLSPPKLAADKAAQLQRARRAHIRHNLTLIDPNEWLESVARRLVRCHVHDVIYPDREHRVPFGVERRRFGIISDDTHNTPVGMETRPQ